MGAKDSKRACISHEEAVKRMSEAELRRICEMYKRLTGTGGGSTSLNSLSSSIYSLSPTNILALYSSSVTQQQPVTLMSKAGFAQHVLGDGVPHAIVDALYSACGGTNRGIGLKDVVCGLALLTRGTYEERIRLLWSLYCNGAGTYITRSDFLTRVRSEGVTNKEAEHMARSLFGQISGSGGGSGGVSGGSASSSNAGTDTRVPFEHFRAWLEYCGSSHTATPLANWLLYGAGVQLSCTDNGELQQSAPPTFYQTLAGVTHLDEADIGELEKRFWMLQSVSPTGNLDMDWAQTLLCPPIPLQLLEGLFSALDVNGDGHIDFKELCCGISAACRGPKAERMKFCFKMFDCDQDCYLDATELRQMLDILYVIRAENEGATLPQPDCDRLYEEDTCIRSLYERLDAYGGLSQEEFLMWCVNTTCHGCEQHSISSNHQSSSTTSTTTTKQIDVSSATSNEECELKNNHFIEPLLNLLFEVCHISLGLKPLCRHHEHDIVRGWLEREERRGHAIGQHWYLISLQWWQQWTNYTTTMAKMVGDHCSCASDAISLQMQSNKADDAMTCDDSLISSSTNNSNSMESMSCDLISNRCDSCSIASSSGVSSNSTGTGTSKSLSQRHCSAPGPIDNTALVTDSPIKAKALTGEGGLLRRDKTLVQHRDFELVPDTLWRALAHWYGGPLPLPRQVIRNRHAATPNDLELELYPINVVIVRHQQTNASRSVSSFTTSHSNSSANLMASWANSIIGGYGVGTLNSTSSAPQLSNSTNSSLALPPGSQSISMKGRYVAYQAAFSRLTTVRQVSQFLCEQLHLAPEEVRLWLMKGATVPSGDNQVLLDDDDARLEEIGLVDFDHILLEVRNKDLTWPEEIVAISSDQTPSSQQQMNDRRRGTIHLPPGATGLHNLGNTCFMNAAVQAVSNTRPLTIYFQRDGQLCELNTINPLGTKGLVAKRYAELCRELWTGAVRSVAPLKLRYCVTKHAPHLGGGGQHDSQELLAWLLDSLHEDLNRVTQKQYTELKDSAGRPDEVVAQEAWNQHLARDHSIITDLFYGQLKSKVTCQTCGHASVRFDPFNLLSLPLPMENYTLCEVLLVYASGCTPKKFGLRLNSDSKYSQLREKLAQLCGISSERLILAEVKQAQIRQVLNVSERINAQIALELYAYELPEQMSVVTEPHYSVSDDDVAGRFDNEEIDENDSGVIYGSSVETEYTEAECAGAPLRDSPEVRGGSALCMPNILCFKNKLQIAFDTLDSASEAVFERSSSIVSRTYAESPNSGPVLPRPYVTVVHRKCVRQESYFLTQHKTKSILFGMPLILGCDASTTCQAIYEAVWRQVNRLLSPLPQSDQTNHATDCDDSLGYEFPFTLKIVQRNGLVCAICNWTEFCRGCVIPCSKKVLLQDLCNQKCLSDVCIALDWEPTALHLRYQSGREKLCDEDESVAVCRRLHTEPIDLDHCLRAFTSEERLEAMYHCSNCNSKQPATKKLQIWRLPPILIIHLKRFDCVHGKWAKTQKPVNFPFKDFDPTDYLASTPQHTIHLHRQRLLGNTAPAEKTPPRNTLRPPQPSECGTQHRISVSSIDCCIGDKLTDYHGHKLQAGMDPFHISYQLYAVVSHSGMLNGGHYVSYACNPNGNWYCYNDSSCREVAALATSGAAGGVINRVPALDTSSAYILFYERSGLDYTPYLPDYLLEIGETDNNGEVDANDVVQSEKSCMGAINTNGVVFTGTSGGGGGGGVNLGADSDIRKQACTLQ